MKVENIKSNIPNLTARNRLSGKPYFGSASSSAAEEMDRLVRRAVRETSPDWLRFFPKLKLGETTNNWITAIGTAGVAPIFIIHNPFTKDQDPKTKEYTAWRQPISAAITLAILQPTANWWTYQIDKSSAFYRIMKIDLSAKPPESLLKKQINGEWKEHRAQAVADITGNGKKVTPKALEEALEKLTGYRNKDYFDVGRLEELQKKAFYRELGNRRADKANYIFDDDDKVEALKEQYKANYDMKVIGKSALAGSDDRKDAQLELLQEKLKGNEKYKNYTDNMLNEELQKLFKCDEYSLKDNIKDALNDFKKNKNIWGNLGLEENDVKYINNNTLKRATTKVVTKLTNEAKIKFITSQVFKQWTNGDTELKNISLNEQQEIYDLKYKELKKKIDLGNFEKKIDGLQVEVDKKTWEAVLKKIKNQGSLERMYYHGDTFDEVLKSVYLKKWLRATTDNAYEALKTASKKSGMLFAIPFAIAGCYVLNWVYPRFMDKFFPELAAAKKGGK